MRSLGRTDHELLIWGDLKGYREVGLARKAAEVGNGMAVRWGEVQHQP